MSVSKVPVAMAPDSIDFFLCGPEGLAIPSHRSGRAEVVSSGERSMAVGASGFPSAVDARGTLVLVKAGTAHVTAGVSSALCWVAKALASRVVASDCGLLVNRLGELAGVE